MHTFCLYFLNFMLLFSGHWGMGMEHHVEMVVNFTFLLNKTPL